MSRPSKGVNDDVLDARVRLLDHTLEAPFDEALSSRTGVMMLIVIGLRAIGGSVLGEVSYRENLVLR